jgi:hypothetical protein
MAAFPSLKPTQRTMSMGQAPVKEYRALNGVVVRRSFGNKRFAYLLNLTFENIPESSLALLWDHYHNNQNLQNGFSLPDEVFNGYSTDSELGLPIGFKSRINRMSDIVWFYAEPPNIESVVVSYSTVTVSLSGELRYQP